MKRFCVLSLLALFTPFAARAEFLQMDLSIFGMD